MKKKISWIAVFILVAGLLVPQKFVMPVSGGTNRSYNNKSFWYYPWGRSKTHKGVDIFAKEGTTLSASTHGIVLYSGSIKVGGNVVLVLGPRWRVHYYAHLNEINTGILKFVSPGERIGTVGTTGNAKGKPPHLHYSIITLIPYPWRIDDSVQGWKKIFYLNPIDYLNEV